MKLCIKNLVDKSGYTKKAVAEKLGVTRQYVYSLYNGTVKEITIERIEKLCEIFNCTPNNLFEINTSSNSENLSEKLSDSFKNFDEPITKLEDVKLKEPDHFDLVVPTKYQDVLEYLLRSGYLQYYIDDRINKAFDERKKDDTE